MKRWQGGFLEAYLRQRLASESGKPSPLLKQIEKVRRDFAQKPFAAFETTLRLLDPSIPPLEIEFDSSSLKEVWELSHGQEATRAIAFRTKGMGVPFAAGQLQSQWAGLQLETHEIAQRNGQIQLKLYSQGDIPVGREFIGTISLAGNTTRLVGENVKLRYRVSYQKSQTLNKILIGAVLGAVLMGGLRAGLMLVAPRALDLATASLLGRGTWPVLLGGLLLMFYLAYRIWLWALVKYAQ